MKATKKNHQLGKKSIFDKWADKPKLEQIDKEKHAGRYIKLSKDGSAVAKDKKDEMTKMLQRTFGVKTANDYLDKLARKDLVSNAAFVEFMIDYGAKSDVFTPWVLRVPDPSNLFAAVGRDVEGNEISTEDPFWWWVVRDPMFVSARWRTAFVAKHIEKAGNVVILGAGYLPEIKKLQDEKPKALPKKIIACDMNERASAWGAEYAKTLGAKEQLEYRHEDLLVTLMSLPEVSQDIIVSTGVASYCVDKLPALVPLIFSKLKPGGSLILDLQIEHWVLLRNAEVFGWKTDTFTPSKDLKSAVATIKKSCAKLPVDELNYYVDERSSELIGVMFEIKKTI